MSVEIEQAITTDVKLHVRYVGDGSAVDIPFRLSVSLDRGWIVEVVPSDLYPFDPEHPERVRLERLCGEWPADRLRATTPHELNTAKNLAKTIGGLIGEAIDWQRNIDQATVEYEAQVARIKEAVDG